MPALLAGAALLGMPASASTDMEADYARASTRLQQLVTEQAAKGADLTAEQIEPLIRELTDIRILASARSSKEPLRSIAQVCESAHEGSRALTNFGMDPARPDFSKINANMRRYQAAILRLAEFLAHCRSITVSQIVSLLEARGTEPINPRQSQGLIEVRHSVHFFLRSAILMVAEASFDERLRFRLLDALGETAATYSKSLNAEARHGLRDLAETALRTAPVQFRLNLRKFIDAMGMSACDAICKA